MEQEEHDHPAQIDASFGGMTVFVSGSDDESLEEVEETFQRVWEEMMTTSEKMQDMADEMENGGNDSSRTFG